MARRGVPSLKESNHHSASYGSNGIAIGTGKSASVYRWREVAIAIAASA